MLIDDTDKAARNVCGEGIGRNLTNNLFSRIKAKLKTYYLTKINQGRAALLLDQWQGEP